MTIAAKICGLSSEAGVAAAVEGGAAYLGFVFYKPSPRAVSPAQAAALCAAAPEDVAAAARYETAADMLLFDAKPPRRADALPGGNGLAFDWHLIAGQRWRVPWMLSGGLTSALLLEAVRISGAVAVDVSSGVERRPGDKDPDKIREFLRVARSL